MMVIMSAFLTATVLSCLPSMFQVNIIHRLVQQKCKEGAMNESVMSWLPQYHDMGLIGTFLSVSGNVHRTGSAFI